MSNTVIQIENLSKIYRLGEVGTGTLSHDLNRWFRMNILGQEDPYAKVGHVNDRTQKAEKGELVAALQDINLEVKQGEVLGIIGKNGAGKSTLLKLLSRVTSPTTGIIKTKGRLASLLEVGTGFHPEMTGRENVYMNGTIMGMRKWEITKKLDEIVDFAGVAKYLDTPVKRYSSGMMVRLGFAVAAFLEPEILIVDEVLAVGDVEYQRKAINKIREISNSGKTILLVSHNMASIRSISKTCIHLDKGTIKQEGSTETVVSSYLAEATKENGVLNDLIKNLKPDPVLKINEINITQDGHVLQNFLSDKDINIHILFEVFRDTVGFRLFFDLYDEQGILLVRSFHDENENSITKTNKGKYSLHAAIPKNLLASRQYILSIKAGIYNERRIIGDQLNTKINVEKSICINSGYPSDVVHSKIQPKIKWELDLL